MSYDWKIEKTCDHKIQAETLYWEPDLQTIRFDRPISSDTVQIYINDILRDPNDIDHGYVVMDDEYSVKPNKKRKLFFKTPSKAPDDVIECSYYTFLELCPKCHGIKAHNDLEWGIDGKPFFVAQGRKLTQEFKKGLITELNSNPFHSWIGTTIYTRIGSKVVDAKKLQMLLLDEISSFATKYKSVQQKQIAAGQEVELEEIFSNIAQLKVQPRDPNVPIIWDIFIRLIDGTGQVVQIKTTLQMPV
jgi:hypothetical protein